MRPTSTEHDPVGALDSLCLVVVGTGPVGRALASGLARAGAEVLLVSRDEQRARSEAERLARELSPSAAARVRGVARAALEAGGGRAGTDAAALLLCVPDRAIAPTAAALARGAVPAVALHTSGALGREVLGPLADAGASVGSLHPLGAFAPGEPPRDRTAGTEPLPAALTRELAGIWFALEGEPPALALASRIVEALGARRLALSDTPGAKVAYHAAAALLSNGLVALFAAALRELEGSARDPEQARTALLALLQSTARNLEAERPERALTGPVARGDGEVVRAHLTALAASELGGGDSAAPSTAALYRELMRGALALARAEGRAPAADLDVVAALLARDADGVPG